MQNNKLNIRSLKNIAAVLALAVALPAAVSAQALVPPTVPSNLQVPSGNTMFLKGYAVGTQNYVCMPSGPAGTLAWKFQGPQATLFLKFRWFNSEMLQQVATHYLSASAPEEGNPARPTWQSSVDTSAVWGKKLAESSDPSYVEAGAIPWLLLQAAATQRGPTQGNSLSQTTYIQRVHTSGGGAPTSVCTEPGAIQFVPYTTDYYFYRASNGNNGGNQ